MKRLLFLIVVVLFTAAAAIAAPFLVCDYQAGVTHYQVDGLPVGMNGTQAIPAHNATYGFKYDLATLPPGTYTLKARACRGDATWGGVCSADSNPLILTRPSPPSAPVGSRVTR